MRILVAGFALLFSGSFSSAWHSLMISSAKSAALVSGVSG